MAVRAGLCLVCSETPETDFLVVTRLMCTSVLDVDRDCTWALSNASCIWNSRLKYECSLGSCKLQFHGHHTYFRKDIQMLLTLKEGHMYPPQRALGHI